MVTGRLAQGVDCPGVVDVMVGQDHPSEILGLKVAIGHEAEDRLVATGVAGIDHSQPVEPSEQIGLCATNAIDAMNQLDRSVHYWTLGVPESPEADGSTSIRFDEVL